MREPLLRLAGITKSFGDFQAIDNLSLDVRRGEIFALLGPSGCGKSTTLRQIAGFDQPDRGTITLGPRTLRAETAPLVAASAILYEMGDLE